ncbi:MAG: PAS domain S-box protein [candidate division Zixibacteria bacterium]|nr:PAS domain S-box protein [candidate division Zixibacteria bacterium]NIR66843.1 PAS domain S-box protein [candidate division Zixibacteria bacterium]NIS15222.1 PAS domain S-box protein [candidate division Zixibacteria bacterium]NIS48342.1 PAS domain S-box protein [candidate division Zixibacteria bacterium]NIT51736.1 PAS domain S-box protein [candidate division Zixibacteria bacterium]
MHSNEFMKEKIDSSEIQDVVREMVIESERKYQTLIENSLVGIIIYSDDHIVYANPRFNEIFGYDSDEYQNIPIWEFVHPDYREIARERAYQRISGKEIVPQYELKAMRKDGTVVDIMLKSARMTYNGKPALIVNMVDITELKNAQREIRELSTIVQSALIPILKLDEHGKVLYVNKSAEQLFGIELEKMRGKNLAALITGVDPEEMQEHVIRQTRRGGFDSMIICRKADGAPIKIRLTTAPLVNDKNKMTAIACFLVDPRIEKAEENSLNAEESATVKINISR